MWLNLPWRCNKDESFPFDDGRLRETSESAKNAKENIKRSRFFDFFD